MSAIDLNLWPNMAYQEGGDRAFPHWVPAELLPDEVEDFVEELTEVTRGLGNGTRAFGDLFSDEERELRAIIVRAPELCREVPL